MAKKKKTTKKSGWFSGFFSKKTKGTRSKKKNQQSLSHGLKIAAGIVAATLLIGGAAVGFIYMDRYVKDTVAQRVPDGSLELIGPPTWLNQEWVNRLVETAGGERFPLDDHSAARVAQRLGTLSWLDNVHVRTTPQKIEVSADYRRPVGVVSLGGSKYYLDRQMTVMEYLPVTAFATVEITGVGSPRSMPAPGNRWAAEDAAAAVELLDWLYKMDLHFQLKKDLEKPLLDEIDAIDVSNFAARKSNSQPHITLTVKDGTKVFWGAAWGQAARYLEQDEQKKLVGLYQYYMDHNNTLQGTAKYIELRQL
jgi:hypothetical protein